MSQGQRLWQDWEEGEILGGLKKPEPLCSPQGPTPVSLVSCHELDLGCCTWCVSCTPGRAPQVSIFRATVPHGALHSFRVGVPFTWPLQGSMCSGGAYPWVPPPQSSSWTLQEGGRKTPKVPHRASQRGRDLRTEGPLPLLLMPIPVQAWIKEQEGPGLPQPMPGARRAVGWPEPQCFDGQSGVPMELSHAPLPQMVGDNCRGGHFGLAQRRAPTWGNAHPTSEC